MAAFSAAAFDAAFDSGGGSAPAEYATVTLGLAVHVVEPQVFATAAGYLSWAITATVAAQVLTPTGEISITASEDSARVATFSVVPASDVHLASFESSLVTLDITLFRGAQTATLRRFTGVVETVEFDPASRVATLSCRDGYQERAKACRSAADVEALFGTLATPSAKALPWSDDEPDPVSYFRGLQDTALGAVFIDNAGIWRAVPWAIGAAAATFGENDVWDGSIRVQRANRRELPLSVRATLNFRYNRLHCAEKQLVWDDPGAYDHALHLIPVVGRSTIQQAIDGLSGWIVKGKPTMTGPVPGVYPVIYGAQTLHYIVDWNTAQTAVDHLDVTMYKRWYQQVQAVYQVDIPVGGSSDREDVSAVSISSSFDADLWETTPTAEDSLGIYASNAPTVTVPPTGYEGLPDPHPSANSALDYYPDVTNTELQTAVVHVVAKALRRAAAGRRKQTVSFERPIDPRWEIGDVISINALGVSAVGQVVEFSERLDIDTGEAVTTITLACPDGDGASTSLTASVVAPTASVLHALYMPALSTHKGSWTSTLANPVEDDLLGYLCNVTPTSPQASPTAPVYIPQFRIIMPSIPANVRDPISINLPITASVSIAGSGLSVVF